MKKIYLIFVIGFLIIATPLFLFPINLFPGQIVYDHIPHAIDCHLSLSYFIGLGYEINDMKGVESFYLTMEGYLLAFSILIGFPFLLAYRSYLKRSLVN
tara:strand:+ start:216 stop:512 length:297 start_codon:yes stop_codon:yes gene_type:complete